MRDKLERDFKLPTVYKQIALQTSVCVRIAYLCFKAAVLIVKIEKLNWREFEDIESTK